VNLAVFFTKLLDSVSSDGVHKLIHEPFGRNEIHLEVLEFFKDSMADRVD